MNNQKRMLGILYDLVVRETEKAWLLADRVDEEADAKVGEFFTYSQEGERYNKNAAIWFPKSQCLLKDLANEGYELQLPTWLAESKDVIDYCYDLKEISNEESPFDITAEEVPGWVDEGNDIPF